MVVKQNCQKQTTGSTAYEGCLNILFVKNNYNEKSGI